MWLSQVVALHVLLLHLLGQETAEHEQFWPCSSDQPACHSTASQQLACAVPLILPASCGLPSSFASASLLIFSVTWACRRNELVALNMLISAVTLSVGVIAAVAGIFGTWTTALQLTI